MSEQAAENATGEKPEAKTEDAPETTTEQAEGHEVHVTRDEGGITSMSEDEAGADPRVDRMDESGESDKDDKDSKDGPQNSAEDGADTDGATEEENDDPD